MARIRPRRVVAVNAGKITALASRQLGRGGGTALPGIVASRVDPGLARDLAGQLELGSVVVSGTNGKTTTSRLLATILTDAGLIPIRNDSGSNLLRGVASSLVRHANLFGNIADQRRTIGLFEVDEAALPGIIGSIAPCILVLLDLFRDQLDRYGEVATIARLWSGALRQLPSDASVVVNADDPLLADTASNLGRPVSYFGIESTTAGTQQMSHASDVKACPRCGGPIHYSVVFFGHLGHYRCDRCSFSRPAPEVTAAVVEPLGVEGVTFTLRARGRQVPVSLPLPGLYNVYNALAAAAVAGRLGIDLDAIAAGLGRATPAFGRMERLSVEGRDVFLALAKNPTGLNEVLRTILQSRTRLHLLLMLNDNVADGHDVSWIWDADVEMLAGRVDSVVSAGTRGADMGLRLKYGGVIAAGADPAWELVLNTEAALGRAIALTPPGDTLFIVPTYTALLAVRETLAGLGHVRPYWEE